MFKLFHFSSQFIKFFEIFCHIGCYVRIYIKYFNGTKWVLVNNKATEDISQIKQQIADLEQNKEDKVEGKGLSTEDYTTQEKNKLASLQNYNDDEVRELISALNLRLTTLEGDYEALEARVAALETPAA